VVGPGRVDLAAAVRSSSVVVLAVLRQDRLQVSFAEDQHPVGDPGPGGDHESFGVSVRARASGRNLRCGDAGAGQDRVEGFGKLTVERKPPACRADERPLIGFLWGGRLQRALEASIWAATRSKSGIQAAVQIGCSALCGLPCIPPGGPVSIAGHWHSHMCPLPMRMLMRR
jgi:hypothetical protein